MPAFLVALVFSLFSSFIHAKSVQAWAYQAWWMPYEGLTKPGAKLDRVLFFELKVGNHGGIVERNGWPEKWSNLRADLKKNSTPLDLTLTILNVRDFETLFQSEESVNRLLEQCNRLIIDGDVAGLHLDFEVYSAVSAPALGRFRQFMVDLAKNMRSQIPVKQLSVFLPIGGEVQIYDVRSLAQVDHVVAQGYDAHWRQSPTAGPVAPLDGPTAVTWKKAAATALLLGVKKERLLLSYPLYGYEWKTKDKNPRGISLGEGVLTTLIPIDPQFLPDIQNNVYERTKRLGTTNDPLSGSSYYQFRKNEQWFTGWYEGQWALGKKMEFLRDQKIGGVAFFVKGYDGGEIIDSFLQGRIKREGK